MIKRLVVLFLFLALILLCTSCLLFFSVEEGHSEEQIRTILSKLVVPRLDPEVNYQTRAPYEGVRSEWFDGPANCKIKYYIDITGRDDGKPADGMIFVAGKITYSSGEYRGTFSYSFNMEDIVDSNGETHSLYFAVDLTTVGLDDDLEVTEVHYRHFTYDNKASSSFVVRKLPLGTMNEKLLIQDACLLLGR